MITDKDIKKLKEVFITKDDAMAFATKDDLEKTNKSIGTMSEDIITVIEMVGDIGNKLDKKVDEHDDLLEHHERQIDRLNDKVFPTT